MNNVLLIIFFYIIDVIFSFSFFSIYLNNYQSISFVHNPYSTIDSQINYVINNQLEEYSYAVRELISSVRVYDKLNTLDLHVLIDHFVKRLDFTTSYEVTYLMYLNNNVEESGHLLINYLLNFLKNNFIS